MKVKEKQLGAFAFAETKIGDVHQNITKKAKAVEAVQNVEVVQIVQVAKNQ